MKIFVAGHKGLVGSALCRHGIAAGHDVITRDRLELDLLDASAVERFLKREKPDWTMLAAARVGGIHANSTYPVEFLLDNVRIQNNVIESSYRAGTTKLLFLGSSCIYPRLAPQPISETALLSSPLEPTNEAYAIAKIAGIKLCAAFNKEYGTDYISVMPCNLFGRNDNYHPENAHALPMLLRRIHEAKEHGLSQVTVWGTGTPLREFMFGDDLAEGCFFLMQGFSAAALGELINLGTGQDCTIRELVDQICSTVGYKGKLVFDPSKPDGTPRKLLDVSKINRLGWRAATSLQDGLRKTYEDFLSNNKTLRM